MATHTLRFREVSWIFVTASLFLATKSGAFWSNPQKRGSHRCRCGSLKTFWQSLTPWRSYARKGLTVCWPKACGLLCAKLTSVPNWKAQEVMQLMDKVDGIELPEELKTNMQGTLDKLVSTSLGHMKLLAGMQTLEALSPYLSHAELVNFRAICKVTSDPMLPIATRLRKLGVVQLDAGVISLLPRGGVKMRGPFAFITLCRPGQTDDGPFTITTAVETVLGTAIFRSVKRDATSEMVFALLSAGVVLATVLVPQRRPQGREEQEGREAAREGCKGRRQGLGFIWIQESKMSKVLFFQNESKIGTSASLPNRGSDVAEVKAMHSSHVINLDRNQPLVWDLEEDQTHLN